MNKQTIGFLLRLLGSGLLLWLIFLQVDFSEFAHAIEEALWLPLLGAAVTLIVIRVLMGIRLWMVARCFHIQPSMHACYAMVLSSSLAGFVLPGGVATDVVRGFQLSRLFRNPAAALSAVLLDRFFGIVAILAVGCAAWQFAPPGLPELAAWFLYLALAGSVLVSLFGPTVVRILPSRIGFVAKAQTMAMTLAKEAQFSRNYVYLLLLSIVIQLLRCLIYVFLFLAFAVPVNPAVAFVVVPILFIIIMAPITIGGLGVREGVLILMLVPLGATVESLTLVGLASHLIEFVTTLPGAWYLWRGIPEKRDATATA